MSAPRAQLLDLALLALRVGGGGLLLYGHGWAKLVHFGERASSFADPIGLGSTASLALVVFAEVLCASLVVIGLGTRLATGPILIFMAVAAFVQHAHDPWPKRELPLLFATVFAAIALIGPGRYSLDAIIRRKG